MRKIRNRREPEEIEGCYSCGQKSPVYYQGNRCWSCTNIKMTELRPIIDQTLSSIFPEEQRRLGLTQTIKELV